uniref:Reverse transcriptase domain-containing protein n=1 Tax=Fagus sylvatica TaxID=28930 RepID=A0A2N9IN55_FAGSY
MAAKLDMSKAYDRVEWDYLRAILTKLGFHARWVSLVMECVTTVTYSVMMNGEQKGFIKPARGLRQGDPLSPYLFLICAEGLSALLRKAERDSLIQGVSICRGGPRVSHLFFADDSIIFCRATMAECNAILMVLSLYENASGQKVNSGKTALFFSHNTLQCQREVILQMFGATPTTRFEKYLGLPPIIGRAKKQIFHEIKDRVWRRLQGWKEKFLSQAGREVLIKSVIQAIPTYAMSCFKLPLGFCSELTSMATRFWWGQKGTERKVHWLSKTQLMRSKHIGGMGFRDLHIFNMALLARQGWRLLQYPNSIVSRVLKAKYYPGISFLEATVKSNASFIWRSICEAKKVLLAGMRWRVGTGSSIKIWSDPWLQGSSCAKVLSPLRILDEHATVDALILTDQRCWNTSLVDQIFTPYEAAIIKKIPLSYRCPQDRIIWGGTQHGEFSVRTAYRLLYQLSSGGEESTSTGGNKAFWLGVWKARVPPKIRNFIWRACRKILPTHSKLFEKQISSSLSCQWCEEEVETCDHVLWQCEFAQRVWAAGVVQMPVGLELRMSFIDVVEVCLRELTSPDVELEE